MTGVAHQSVSVEKEVASLLQTGQVAGSDRVAAEILCTI